MTDYAALMQDYHPEDLPDYEPTNTDPVVNEDEEEDNDLDMQAEQLLDFD